MFTLPTVADFKNYFLRDFPYQPPVTPPAVVDLDSYIQDQDIQNALDEADGLNNQELFGDQASFTFGFLNLAAHYLCMNLRASSQGIGGRFDWGAQSKSVGSVSVSTAIPARILENPLFAYLNQTTYGTKYLMKILPQISGQMFVVCGGTNP